MIGKIAIATAVIALLGVGGFFLLRPASLPAPAPSDGSDVGNPPQGAWIEVIAPPVSEYGAESPALLRELGSGDTVVPGTAIGSAAGAKAVIHFPDGSVARLDEKSRITVAEEIFDAEDKGSCRMEISGRSRSQRQTRQNQNLRHCVVG